MARVSCKMPEEFLAKISKLGKQTDIIVPKVLEAGGEVVRKKVKSNLASVIGNNTKYKSKSTGELISSLGVSSALQDKEGNFNVKVGFRDKRSDGRSNAMIASILEYGKVGQPAKPYMKPAKTASKKACIKAMEEKLESEIRKL